VPFDAWKPTNHSDALDLGARFSTDEVRDLPHHQGWGFGFFDHSTTGWALTGSHSWRRRLKSWRHLLF